LSGELIPNGHIPRLDAYAHLSRCRDGLAAAAADGVEQRCIISAPVVFPPNLRKGKEGEAARAYLGSAFWEVQLRVRAHGFEVGDGTLAIIEHGTGPSGEAYFQLVWTLTHIAEERVAVEMAARHDPE
jgi:hypothetical protein